MKIQVLMQAALVALLAGCTATAVGTITPAGSAAPSAAPSAAASGSPAPGTPAPAGSPSVTPSGAPSAAASVAALSDAERVAAVEKAIAEYEARPNPEPFSQERFKGIASPPVTRGGINYLGYVEFFSSDRRHGVIRGYTGEPIIFYRENLSTEVLVWSDVINEHVYFNAVAGPTPAMRRAINIQLQDQFGKG